MRSAPAHEDSAIDCAMGNLRPARILDLALLHHGWTWFVVGAVATAWSVGLARHNFSAHAFAGAGSWAYHDEGALALAPLLLLEGGRPYKDFEPRYTPLGYYVFALGYKAFGVDLYSLRLILAGVNVTVALLVFGIARGAGAGSWAWLAPLGSLAWGVTEYNVAVPRWLAVPLGLSVSAYLAWKVGRIRITEAAVAGVALGLTFLFSQNTGIAAIAAALWTLSFCHLADAARDAGPPVRRAGSRACAIATAGVAAVVLGAMVWPGAAVPSWWMIVSPGAAITVGLLGLARQHPTTRPARHLLSRLLAMSIGGAAAIGVCAAWWIRASDWEAVRRSIAAGATSLDLIYRLPPPAPTLGLLAAALLWSGAFLLQLRGSPRGGLGARRPCAVAALALAGTVCLWAGWWTGRPAGWVPSWLYLCERLVTDGWPHLLWLTGCVTVAVVFAERYGNAERELGRNQAMAAATGFATLAGWTHLYPWGDYTHALWAAPPATAACAFLVGRAARHGMPERAGSPSSRVRRWLPLGGLATAPLSVLLAMLMKWATYGFDSTATLTRGRLVPREFALVDQQHGRIYMEQAAQRPLAEAIAYIRERTSPTDPVLGLPLLPLINVVTPRPFPLYDCFWWPDFTGRVRSRQAQDAQRVLENRRVPLVVGPVSDDTYFSLPVLRETWPEVWTALNQEYRRTAVFGSYWIYEPRPR